MMFAHSLPAFHPLRTLYAGISVITFAKATVTTIATKTKGG